MVGTKYQISVILLFCSHHEQNNKTTKSIVVTDSLAGAVLLSECMVSLHFPNVGKPDDGVTQGLTEGRGSVANI